MILNDTKWLNGKSGALPVLLLVALPLTFLHGTGQTSDEMMPNARPISSTLFKFSIDAMKQVARLHHSMDPERLRVMKSFIPDDAGPQLPQQRRLAEPQADSLS